jgi:hypothetical protein
MRQTLSLDTCDQEEDGKSFWLTYVRQSHLFVVVLILMAIVVRKNVKSMST